MAKQSRLGLYGGPRGAYAGFVAKPENIASDPLAGAPLAGVLVFKPHADHLIHTPYGDATTHLPEAGTIVME